MHIESNLVEGSQRTFISKEQHVSTELDDFQRSLPPSYLFFPSSSVLSSE